ncbi:hypothetical protein ACFSTE_21075 [Aquimarina hainanensis]|uniref:Uncharacterized protein n=1 Tax=Aquimarina hainanensis TaxID=1578017 RepID=A0ABW5NCQ5_9FLAO
MRFKNQWYYILSGELLQFDKIKKSEVIFSTIGDIQRDNLTVFADALVNIKENKRELYTGYVLDYDLSIDDVSELDKLYLGNAKRYKKCEETKKTKPINIPGDVFIINASNIININLTYITDPFSKKKRNMQKAYSISTIIRNWIVLILLVWHAYYYFVESDYILIQEYMNKTSFWGKLFFFFLVNQFTFLFIPSDDSDDDSDDDSKDSDKNNEDKVIHYFYSFKDISYKILIMLFFAILFYFTVCVKMGYAF